MTARADCRAPEACRAKGAGLCRGCTGAIMMARLLADPERIAARAAKSAEARRTDEHRAHLRARRKRQGRDPKFRKAMREAGRRTVAKLNTDPALRVKAATSLRSTLARRTAERASVPLDLVPAFRALRRRHFPVEEAVAVLRASYPAAFATLEVEHRIAALRTCGPAPAIGTPKRAAWTRAVVAMIEGGASGAAPESVVRP